MSRDESNFFTENFPSPEQIRNDIARDGFQIYHDVLSTEVYGSIRSYWLEYFSNKPSYSSFVRGGIFLGEKNFNSYSKCHHWDLYRYFDFLWNSPAHELSRAVSLAIHKKRNLAQGFQPDYGLTYNPEGYGVYISVSYYPAGGGYFEMHEDGHSETPLLHFMLPITFQGEDYASGGLVCYTKEGERVDVDAQMKPGSLVFFDGRQRHGVEPIQALPEKSRGRLAIFAIPTFFKNGSAFAATYRDMRNKLFFSLEGAAIKARDVFTSRKGI